MRKLQLLLLSLLYGDTILFFLQLLYSESHRGQLDWEEDEWDEIKSDFQKIRHSLPAELRKAI